MQFRKLAIGALLAITAPGLAPVAIANTPSTTLPYTRFDYLNRHLGNQAAKPQVTRFNVRIENISTTDEFTASNGAQWTLDFSPGVWLVSDSSNPLFVRGQKDRGQGLEAIAEDGNPTLLAKSLQNQSNARSSGVFNTPVGATQPKGIRPGQAFEFTVTAAPGQKLSVATMFGQSNDWFYAPTGSGIALFDANGNPIQGDVTSQIVLWNDGTEVDEEPGIGPTQGPRQKAPNTGVDEKGVVQMVNTQAAYSKTNKVMRVTITPQN